MDSIAATEVIKKGEQNLFNWRGQGSDSLELRGNNLRLSSIPNSHLPIITTSHRTKVICQVLRFYNKAFWKSKG